MKIPVTSVTVILIASALVSGCNSSDEHMPVKAQAASGGAVVTAAMGSAPTYAKIRPILGARCSACHNNTSPIPNWMSYDVAYAKRDRILDRVYAKKDMPMPPFNTLITEDERALIAAWVNGGALKGDEGGGPQPQPQPEPQPTPPVVAPHDCDPRLNSELLAAIKSGSAPNVDKLFAQGACANAAENGATALLWAEYNDYPEVAQLLVSHGADVNAQIGKGTDNTLENMLGYSPLMLAVQNAEPASMNVLLNAGANPALKAASGETAGSLAAQSTDTTKKPVMVQLLAAFGENGALRVPTYSREIRPLLEQRCGVCHNASNPSFNWLDYQTAIQKKALIYVRAVVIKDMPMNDNMTHITDEERATLARWIQAGAPK